MGGVKVNTQFESTMPNLFASGEAVGGANGANRLSGNAITEALVFGARAGRSAAAAARATNGRSTAQAFAPALDLLRRRKQSAAVNPAALIGELQRIMMDKVGPFRTEATLDEAIAELDRLTQALGDDPASTGAPFDSVLLDWLDLRNMVQVAKSVAVAARTRRESRGSHQREDFPSLDPAWQFNQVVRMNDGKIELSRSAAPQKARALAGVPA
jgi:succinate dehydrogenase/fumarate reductase flavoprotein subunit